MKKLEMKWFDWLIYITIAIGIVGELWYFTTRASAQTWPPTRHCEWRGDCREVYLRRRARERERRAATRVYNYEYRLPEESRIECLARRSVTGTEHATENGALDAAKRAWASRVRWDFGERYTNLEHARHFTYTCNRSSTNETAMGRVAESVAGAFYTRCEVNATPCNAPRQIGGEK